MRVCISLVTKAVELSLLVLYDHPPTCRDGWSIIKRERLASGHISWSPDSWLQATVHSSPWSWESVSFHVRVVFKLGDVALGMSSKCSHTEVSGKESTRQSLSTFTETLLIKTKNESRLPLATLQSSWKLTFTFRRGTAPLGILKDVFIEN